jgi:5-methyltetrahydropteroyltriglutamate--homocysteine methyltransferase
MAEQSNRIFTTHAGSLPRPPELREEMAQHFQGRDTDPAISADLIRTATEAIVGRQIELGLDIINNGEQSRESFFTYVQHRMSGFGGKSERPAMADMAKYAGYRERMVRKAHPGPSVNLMTAPRAIGEIAYTDASQVIEECALFGEVLAAHRGRYADAFVTAASPGIIAAAMQNDFYPSVGAYLDALGNALAVEYRAIADAGFLLQIDAPDLAMERHCFFADQPLGAFLAFSREVIDTINGALEGIDRDRVRLHVCWGNYEGPHDLDVPLTDIWSEIVRAKAGHILISMANPRHAHEYRHFESLDLPPDTKLVAGVIDTTTNYIEHPEVVADRLERLVEKVGDPSRIIAGTDCGFETAAGFHSVHEPIVWEKLKALVEGASIASTRLY